MKFLGDCGNILSLKACDSFFFFRWLAFTWLAFTWLAFTRLAFTAGAGDGAGAKRPAAAYFADVHRLRDGGGHANDHHAMVQKRWKKGQYGCFIAAASACGAKNTGDFANPFPLHPERAGLIQKRPHLTAHVCKSRRDAKDNRIKIGQFVDCGHGGVLINLHGGRAQGVFAHGLWDALEAHVDAVHAPSASGNFLGEGFHMASRRMIQNKNFCHGAAPGLV
jgi:hypothetical protein